MVSAWTNPNFSFRQSHSYSSRSWHYLCPSHKVLKSILQGLQNRKSLPTQTAQTCLQPVGLLGATGCSNSFGNASSHFHWGSARTRLDHIPGGQQVIWACVSSGTKAQVYLRVRTQPARSAEPPAVQRAAQEQAPAQEQIPKNSSPLRQGLYGSKILAMEFIHPGCRSKKTTGTYKQLSGFFSHHQVKQENKLFLLI